MTTENKKFDALKMKEQAQEILNRETEGMSTHEEFVYLEAKSRKGRFAELQRKLDERDAEQGKKVS